MLQARRITGPHLLLDGPGAALELTHEDAAEIRARIGDAIQALGWPSPVVRTRLHQTGTTLAMSAPADQLYTACAVLEWAATGAGRDDPMWEGVLREQGEEANPRLRQALADAVGPVFSDDDFGLTIGLGCHSQTWPLDQIPATLPVGRRIPYAFVTGTNGKTTTTRMLRHIAQAAGYTPGWTSSDAYGVGDQVVESGDWTGPGAARRVLRHPEVDLAILETARGGLLRRGLVMGGADAAAVTNVSSDHLGEWGIHSVTDMALAKLSIAFGVREGGTLVLNRSDAHWREALELAVQPRRPDLRVRFFADNADDTLDAWADDRSLHVAGRVIPLSEVPMSFDGTARHNVENALAAALLAEALGISGDAIQAGLGSMVPSMASSRGRMNRYQLPNGALALVDFAHNPAGVLRVGQTAASWPARRRMLLLGQAGDRTDEDLLALATAVAELDLDTVVLKSMPAYNRGRPLGEVRQIMRQGLVSAGFSSTRIVECASEAEGIAHLLSASEDGDLLLLLVQADLDAAIAQLDRMGASAL